MKVSEVKKLIETHPTVLDRCERLNKRLIEISGTNPTREEFLYKSLDETESSKELVEDIIFNSSYLVDQEVHALELRSLGGSLEIIGKFLGVTKERIRQILNGAYEKIAMNSQK